MSSRFLMILSFISILIFSCENKPIEPFQLIVTDSDQSLAYSIAYKITNKKLSIIFHGELENEKDSVFYATTKLPKTAIRELSNINLDSLGVFYSTSCIRDGDIKSFRFSKQGKTKYVRLQNYFHPKLSPAIEIINNMVPEKFKMHYNKAKLLKDMKDCGEFHKDKSWEAYKK